MPRQGRVKEAGRVRVVVAALPLALGERQKRVCSGKDPPAHVLLWPSAEGPFSRRGNPVGAQNCARARVAVISPVSCVEFGPEE